MLKAAELPADQEGLRRVLHERIERLGAAHLSLLARVALQLEAEGLLAALDAGFDADRAAGRLEPSRVHEVIAQVRREFPCAG